MGLKLLKVRDPLLGGPYMQKYNTSEYMRGPPGGNMETCLKGAVASMVSRDVPITIGPLRCSMSKKVHNVTHFL